MILYSIPHAAETQDCQAGFSNWYHGWSDPKKSWCCVGALGGPSRYKRDGACVEGSPDLEELHVGF